VHNVRRANQPWFVVIPSQLWFRVAKTSGLPIYSPDQSSTETYTHLQRSAAQVAGAWNVRRGCLFGMHPFLFYRSIAGAVNHALCRRGETMSETRAGMQRAAAKSVSACSLTRAFLQLSLQGSTDLHLGCRDALISLADCHRVFTASRVRVWKILDRLQWLPQLCSFPLG
jgi:hypothetical protein